MTGTTSFLDMDSIGRSLQNCSLSSGGATRHRAALSETGDSHSSLELNSSVRLPRFWEQCLDLSSGEVYYINWNTGVKSREDPRMFMSSNFHDARLAEQSILQEQGYVGGEESSYSDDDDDDDDDEEEKDDDEPSSPSSSSSTTTNSRAPAANYYSENESSGSSSRITNNGGGGGDVLVVAGCKACFMYLMVPKQDEECPKCYGKLIHFDRSDSDN